GRSDFQVKLRGFRIELGDIEAALLSQASVREAVVLVREDSPGDQRLVAYVTGDAEPLTASLLKTHLQSRLPEYMVPSTFTHLGVLPLTPSGKVDRKALPAPEAPVVQPGRYVAPRTPVEETLATLFAQVLGVERIGIHDGFFEMGGHSLLATQVVVRVRGALGLELPLRTLFEAPTVAALAERLDARRPGAELPPMVRVDRTKPIPLSFAQQRLWLISQFAGAVSAYNIPLALKLEGVLDLSALQRGFDALMERHEAMRTTFRADGDTPVQVIHPAFPLPFQFVDLTSLTNAKEREAETVRLALEEARRPFDLLSGPLARALLLKLGEQEHALVLNMHHIVSDGWSTGVLVREMAALYAAFHDERPSPLPALPVQYADFAVWQRDWLQGPVLEEQVGYWRKKLEGAPSHLDLPTDKPRPAQQSFHGAAALMHLPLPLTEALETFARREGATPFMVLLAAFQVLLQRHSGQDDILVGSPIAGRRLAESEALIGYFANTLVLRSRIRGQDSFRALLAQVRDTTLEAFEHQDVPFEKLVEELHPARDASRTPLFQVSFTLHNAPLPALSLPGLTLRPMDHHHGVIRFDMELSFHREETGFRGGINYATSLFDHDTVAAMASHLRVLLEEVIASPDVPLAQVSMLTREERNRVLVEWNDTATKTPRPPSIHDAFAKQAERTPQAIALTHAEGQLTYAELRARANQVAHHLHVMGVRPGGRVGLCVERSPELIIGMLGILQAGAAYVPLEPSYPTERLTWIIRESGVSILLTQEHLADELPELGCLPVLLDAEWRAISKQPTSAPVVSVGEEDLAYVMFTSGSTGQPKGVCVPHRGVLRLVRDNTFMRFGPDEVFLQLAPVAFDASTLEVWGALLNGGRLVLAPPKAQSIESLGALLTSSGVTALWLTAALFDQVVQHQGQALAGVRQVLAGGDVLPVQRVTEHLSRIGPDAVFINGYGPTENTTFSATHTQRAGDSVGRSVPIGRPLSSSTAYVLDAALQPVPPGVTGELFVGGDGLAWGYLNRPDLTAERFVPHPYASTPGARLYRTGDKARWRADGTLEFMGRVDFQVKIRGFRIEPGEVEETLRRFAGLRDVVVVAREDIPGDKRLVAYVVPETAGVDVGAVKTFVQRQLPEYMVPSAIVELAALPLSSNGKVDRKALPAPEAPVSKDPAENAPRTPLETQLAAIWAEVLHHDSVGIHDDFFELGGHSLLATQVVSRIRATLGVELPLGELFGASTVAKLAERLANATVAKAPALTRVPRTTDLPLSFAQQRLWFIDQLEPGSTLYNNPFPLRLEGTLDERALRRTFDELVRRHESLRTTFRAEGGQAVQKIHPATFVPVQKVDLSRIDEEDLRMAEALRLSNEEARRPFDLSRGPLLRTLLIKLRPQDHILLLHVHHIVSDGWSLGVFVRELTSLYEAFRKGLPSPLPELAVQYADYAVWQRSWLRGATLEAQVGWWKQQLEGAPYALDVPTDKPRPAVFTHKGAVLDLVIPLKLSQALESLAQKEGATPFMVLMAAFQTLLHRYSGQDDILVGSPIANRNVADTEVLIGFFVNTLVLRARFTPKMCFRELLAQVRERTLGAYEHQGVPFEKIVEELQPTRDASRTPLFQAMFTLQNAPLPEIVLPELSVGPHPIDSTNLAMFELGLDLTRAPEGFSGGFTYSTDLFERATMERFAEHLLVLLRGIVANPGTPLEELPLLPPEERKQLLLEWTGEREPLPADARIHALLEEQVLRTPDVIAVVSGEDSVTYRELDTRATRLAWRLRELGVGLETRVAVCVERSVEQLVALLGVLKAGGAYVPLDPEYPAERLSFMLEDSGARVVVARGQVREKLGDTTDRVYLDVDAVPETGDVAPLSVVVPPEAAAYVLYTSGSTGRPKGVVVQHRSLVNFTRAAWKTYPVELGDRVLQFASISWDTSAEEIYPCLTRGGTLVLRTPDMLDVPEVFLARCEAAGVTQLNLPTAFWHEVTASLEEGRAKLPSKLKWVVIGGERAAPERVAAWRRTVGSALPLRNTYGLTEVTAVATAVDLMASPAEAFESAQEVPIGRPLTNVTTYVLDSAFMPTPTGVVGELFIGGEGVARGYLGRPDLTAERFIPSPFGEGERLYRTGDKARWRRDGGLEYLGRGDTQVKVRGIRIELGEVEAALRARSEVHDAVVLAREDPPGDKRLVAYVVPTEVKEGLEPTLDILGLHDHLRQHLPGYMVPAAFVPLAALPLTPNGKVDRKALTAPDANLHRVSRQHEPPATPLEGRLAELWRELLNVPTVGRRDNFFELGGHSLMATRLVARVREDFKVDLGLRAFFETPTLAGLAERISGATWGDTLPDLGVDRGDGPLPLSFAQQRLWFLDQLQPGMAIYNMPVALRLSGRVERAAFHRAVDELVRRHESLRTTFETVGGEPRQVIHPAQPGNLRVVDLSRVSADERMEEAYRLAREDSLTPFDLRTGPLLRITLLVLDAKEHALLVCMHHSISDGWSQAVLVRELVQLYEAFRSGRPSPLPELPVQYADYALWQRQWLQGETLRKQLDWWSQQLAGAPGALDLHTDKPRPAVLSHQGTTVPVSVSPSLSQALEALARREGVTPFMVWMAAYQALLHRYSGQDDLLVGTPIAGRRHAKTEGLIGFFVNTLVMRASFTPTLTFRRLLAQVRDSTLGAYEHQDVPFERLVEELQPTRDLSRTPLFQALFALQNMPSAELTLPELSLKGVEVESTVSRFELELALVRTPAGYQGALSFSTDLFERSTAERMVTHLLRLVEEAVAKADAPLSSLSLMDEAERQRILVDWNDTAADYPSESTLPALFSEQARRTPEAIALQFEGQRLTYAELEARSGQLARHLLSLGLGREPRIAVLIPRGLELYVALLGILKAGGCYVPLDAAHPQARLAFMLEDSGVAGVLTVSALGALLPSGSWPVVTLDTEWERISRQSTEAPFVPMSSDNLAYVTYTSGSTGTPKGVAITHRGVLRLVSGVGFASREPGEVILQVAPLTFDPTALEVWSALLTGARLAVYPPTTPEVSELARVIDEHRVTTALLATALFDVMQQHEPAALSRLPRLWVGGDVLPLPTARERLAKGGSLINAYGPTEVTVVTTQHVLPAGASIDTAVPIGRPIPNTRVYVLDSSLHPVPVGIPGELFIGGPGLARGYQGRPALTAERFVPDPFSTTPGERLYRTGDKVCWTEDGALRFLGRIDLQVKVRGFRIELGEIEASLRAHPEVREAAVVVREDVPGDKRLVAYVATADGHAPKGEDPKAWLRQRLPEYMVPAHVVFLPALPQSTHGKVDRKALPKPDASGLDTGKAHEAPATPAEQRLAELWKELLQVSRVGRHDSFFELGGHSLLATRLVARIRDELGQELGVRALFESPTLSSLAARLQQGLPEEQGVTVLPPLVAAPRNGLLPLSFAQQRLWFLDQLQPGSALYNIPYALKLTGEVDLSSLQRAFDALVQRHESLRTTFRMEGGEPRQVIHAPAPRPFAMVDLRASSPEQREAEARRVISEDAVRPFDLSTGPLLRVTVMRLSQTEQVLLVCMHHIISDGWSIGVLVRELTMLYTAFHQGGAVELPVLPVQYADYAVWQRGWLQGGALRAQLDWWKQHLDGAAPALELPTDKPRPAVPSSNGALLPVWLPAALSDAVDVATQRERVTPFMLFLAVYQALLQRYSGQEDVVVGSPIAGRRHAQTEGLLGVFINTLALRARFTPELTFRGLLSQVRDATLGAFEHQDLPFERLVEELQPARDLGRTPLFQAMFVLQNAPSPGVSLSGLTLEAMDVELASTKFELNLHLFRAPDGYRGGLFVSTDLFEPATGERLVRHFQQLLERALANPDAPLATLPLLTDAERQRVLVTESAPVSPGLPFHRLFEQQAARTPDAPALRCEEQEWTYRRLDERANQLAHHLRSLGVGPDVPVALCLERGVELIAALLAVLKAGGAYVPLEPSQPAARLRALVEEVSTPVVVTGSAHESAFEGLSLHRVRMDTDEAVLARQSTEALRVEVRAEHLAYVLFTSGSTGRPKGVAVSHGALMSYVNAVIDRLSLTECKSFALVSTFAADLGNTVLFPALVTGGLLHVLTQERARSPEGMAEYFQRHAVDCMKIVPSHLAALLTGGETGTIVPRKRLVLGGESSSWALLERVHALAPECQVFNHYGPTETTVGVLAGRVELPPGDKAPAQVPLGHPLGQTRLYILDASLQPVPVGVPGELYVGGPQVARGYLGRPELTAERFLADPFSKAPEARMYRTGDRVRWLEDGRVEFIGRVDFQVKVRGFRVEPGEVATVLRGHDALRDAIVVARGDGADRKLVAYVVASSSFAPEVLSLRTWLQQRLPEYMVPSAFVTLPALPLTLNGKVDTRALPEPTLEASSPQDLLPPRTPLELQLVRVWEDVLGVRPIGVRSSFFELGGHSLLAVRMMSAVSEAVGRPVPLAALFQAPTVEQLAALLRDGATMTGTSPVVPFGALRPGGKTPFFCVHPVGGNVLCYAELARRLGTERPFVGLQAQGVNGEATPRGTVEEMATAYVDAMRKVQPSGPYLLGGWSLGGVIAYEMARQLREQGQRVELLALIDTYAPGAVKAPEPSEMDRLQVIGMFIQDLLGASLAHVELDLEALAAMSPDAVLEHLRVEGERAGVLPLGTDPRQLQSLLQVFESNLKAARRYVPRPTQERVVLLKATEHDAELPADGGWSTLVGAGLERHPVVGSHYGVLREPGVQALSERLREAMKHLP
ncbi:non-ribosomal peptide synthase/polyketide synthase, partial [Myxococcus sp. XM-1-1-1]|uniref:non-ribosomal peptide synthase/polyketide synthase n=1 Tax=Myxococcus sp. XM-1-1-1 TaxID=2874602 RepID=UPI001CBFEE0A